MRCQSCNAFLCRLCIRNENGKSVCGGCGGPCVPATGDELHTAAERQTLVLRKRESESQSKGAVPPPPPPPPAKGTLAALRGKGPLEPSAPPPPPPPVIATTPIVATVTTAATAPDATAHETMPPPSFKKMPPYFCKNHKDKKALRVCDVCHDEFCEDCVKMIDENPRCMECGAQLQNIPRDEQGLPPIPIATKLKNAFMYPLRGEGKLMLVLGGLFLALGSFDWRGRAATVTYMYAYLMKVCRTSAVGRETPPDWPGSEDYFGIQFFLYAKILSLLPAILFLLVTGTNMLAFFAGMPQPREHHYRSHAHISANPDDDPPQSSAIDDEEGGAELHLVLPYYALSLLGAFYLPMAILACVLFRTKEVLNPVFVFGSIARTRKDYIPAYVILMFAEMATMLGALSGAIIPIVGNAVVQPIWLYLMMVQMRVMGELYCDNRNKLAWFGKKDE